MRRLKSPKLYAAFLALFILGSLYLLFGPKNLLIHHVIQTWEYQADNPSYQEPVQVEIYGVITGAFLAPPNIMVFLKSTNTRKPCRIPPGQPSASAMPICFIPILFLVLSFVRRILKNLP